GVPGHADDERYPLSERDEGTTSPGDTPRRPRTEAGRVGSGVSGAQPTDRRSRGYLRRLSPPLDAGRPPTAAYPLGDRRGHSRRRPLVPATPLRVSGRRVLGAVPTMRHRARTRGWLGRPLPADDHLLPMPSRARSRADAGGNRLVNA